MANVNVTMALFLVAVLFLPAALCQDQKVDEFKLQITEKGTKFEETIEVNTEAETVVFTVPAHNRIGTADVMNDFKRRLTAYRLHDVKTCYVSRLQPDEPSPQLLKESLEKFMTSSNKRLPITVVSRQWIPIERFPSYLLSKEVLNFCGAYPIYRVEQHSVDAVTDIRNTSQSGHHRRTKRAITICQNLASYNLNCESNNWLFSCKVRTASCTYRVICIPDPQILELCSDLHVYNSFVCCDPFCP